MSPARVFVLWQRARGRVKETRDQMSLGVTQRTGDVERRGLTRGLSHRQAGAPGGCVLAIPIAGRKEQLIRLSGAAER